jgi:hypothetical protein
MAEEGMIWRADGPMFLEEDDDRQDEYQRQIAERGFCSSELWSLDFTIVQFILPRLKAYCEESKQMIEGRDGFFEDLEKVIDVFERYEELGCSMKDEDNAEVNEALGLLVKHFRGLWN